MKPENQLLKTETRTDEPQRSHRKLGAGLRCFPSLSSLRSLRLNPFGLRASAFGFTLVELLIVISIIAILASMIIPISGAVSRNRIRAKARTELEQVATGIDLYKAKMGHYPPDNPGRPATNQLYFELLGTTLSNVAGSQYYVTLDGSAQIKVSSLPTVFGNVGGFINTSQGGGGDEGRVATSFLQGVKPGQIALINSAGGNQVKIFASSVPGPRNYLNNICYVSSNPTNNPNSYDLWVDVVISGKTNRISNWNKQPITLP